MSERRHDVSHGMRAGVVIAVLGALGAIVVCVGFAVHALAHAFDAPLAGPNGPMDIRIAGPQLETAPQYDRSRYFAEKEGLLERYEWIDRKNGVARIPIEDAMRVIATAPADDRKQGAAAQEAAQ